MLFQKATWAKDFACYWDGHEDEEKIFATAAGRSLWRDTAKAGGQAMCVPLTQEMAAELCAERCRTNVGSIKLLQITPNVPDGLTARLMESWARHKASTVDQALYEFVMAAYASLPDNLDNTKRPVGGAAARMELTDEMRQRIAAVWRTLPAEALKQKDAPSGLTAAAIKHLTGSGDRRDNTIRKDWWAFLTGYSSREGQRPFDSEIEPDLIGVELEPPPPLKPGGRIRRYPGTEYVAIEEHLHLHFHSEIRRTCVSPKRLLASLPDRPKGLSHKLVARWLRGTIRAAERRYLDYLYFQYKQLPTVQARFKGK